MATIDTNELCANCGHTKGQHTYDVGSCWRKTRGRDGESHACPCRGFQKRNPDIKIEDVEMEVLHDVARACEHGEKVILMGLWKKLRQGIR